MATDSDVLTELGRVTRGDIDLSEFEDWFVAMTWEFDSPLLRIVTGLLAESAGNDGDAVVLEAFERLLERPTATIPIRFTTGTDAVTYPVQFSGSGYASVIMGDMSQWPSVTREAEVQVPA